MLVRLLLVLCVVGPFVAMAQPRFDPARITIARDGWGVPYIFAPTDAEVAYGLAWAQAEDNFPALLEQAAFARGRLGMLQGPAGAAVDYFMAYTQAQEKAARDFDTDLTPAFRDYLDGYAAGLNAYAAANPAEVTVKGVFPITGREIAAGYVAKYAGMAGLAYALDFILKGRPDDYVFTPAGANGSNGMAVRAHRNPEGQTLLMINPHVPLEGDFSFYECHLESQEGLKFRGAVIYGAPTPSMGCTPTHGWAVTFNWPDMVDIYRLTINPKNKNQYRLDGQWVDFIRTRVPLRAKVAGFLPLRVKKELLISKHGPAIRTKDGVFATRYSERAPLRGMEFWLRIAKARNLAEYRAAFRDNGLPLFNFIYADKDDAISYIFNALMPRRAEGYDWQRCLPGDTSAVIWSEYLPFEELPQYLNPECGYLYNSNNTPFAATCPANNLDSTAWPRSLGLHWNRVNNRDLRFRELLYDAKEISWDSVVRINHDMRYPVGGSMRGLAEAVHRLRPEDHPDLADGIRLCQSWDYASDTLNRAAGLIFLTYYRLFQGQNGGYVEMETGITIETENLLRAMAAAQKTLRKNFGRIDPPFGRVQRLYRGDRSYAIGGMPDGLASTYCRFNEDGLLEMTDGDNFTAVAAFDRTGLVRYETIVPLGASSRPGSPHYGDQAPLFAARRYKRVPFAGPEIEAALVRRYHPK